MDIWDSYLDAEDWKAMYTILDRGISEAVDRLKPLPGNREVCDILVKAMMDTLEYQRTVCTAVRERTPH